MKFCKDCKHCTYAGLEPSLGGSYIPTEPTVCRHPTAIEQFSNPVTGAPPTCEKIREKIWYWEQRITDILPCCGREATWFEPQPTEVIAPGPDRDPEPYPVGTLVDAKDRKRRIKTGVITLIRDGKLHARSYLVFDQDPSACNYFRAPYDRPLFPAHRWYNLKHLKRR